MYDAAGTESLDWDHRRPGDRGRVVLFRSAIVTSERSLGAVAAFTAIANPVQSRSKRYPTPRIVAMYPDWSDGSPSFSRSRITAMSTSRESPR